MYEKSYKYMICLLTENCYGDFAEGEYIEGDGIPVCVDFSVAKQFDTAEEAHIYAIEKCQLKLGEYSIHGYYI